MNLRDKYMASDGRTIKTVDIPEWGSVRLRGMSGAQRRRIESLLAEKRPEIELMWAAAVMCVVDEQNAPVFTEEDLPNLVDNMAASIPIQLMPHIDEINGFGGKVQREIAGNSEGTASDDGS